MSQLANQLFLATIVQPKNSLRKNEIEDVRKQVENIMYNKGVSLQGPLN